MEATQAQISNFLTLDDILNTMVAEVRQIIHADRVVIYRVSSSGDGIVVAESVDTACISLLGRTISTPLFRESLALYQQGKTQVINDIQQLELTTVSDELLQQQVKASLTVPILHRSSGEAFIQQDQITLNNRPLLWGLLAIHQCFGQRQWQQLEVELLKQWATQLSIVIEQSELYQQLLAANTNLERQVQERAIQLQQALDSDAMLKRITDKVRSSLDASQTLQTVVQELVLVLGIDGCDSALYNTKQTTSTIIYEYTTRVTSAQGHVVKMADFSIGYSQLLKCQYFQFCELVPSIRSPAAMLACPIFDHKGVLGDLWLFKQRDDAFNELEIQLVQQVASQCAIAIRQARLYQEVQAQVEELQKLSRLKDDFLSTVSHELRTPLANMKMAIQMLAITLNRDQPLFAELAKPQAERNRVARYFEILQNECEREIRLIDDLLDLQSLYAKVKPLTLTSIQLQHWLPQIVESFQERARNGKLCLWCNISAETPPLICDPAILERILRELLDNACKYTPPGEQIVVTAHDLSGMMQLSVSNSGIEIPESELPRVFDKFYRIASTDPWKQSGTGLGLALVKQLVARLGGTIRVESSDGQTRFKLELALDNQGQA